MSRLFRILVSAQAECWYRPVSGAVVPTAQNMPRCATKVKQSVCPSRDARSERSLRRRAISESTLLPREKQLNRRSKKSAELRTISSRCSFVSFFSHAKYCEIPPTNRGTNYVSVRFADAGNLSNLSARHRFLVATGFAGGRNILGARLLKNFFCLFGLVGTI
jgi:hypothetical protein